jgi:hypothetical protein
MTYKPVDRVEFSCDAESQHYRRKLIASGSQFFSVQGCTKCCPWLLMQRLDFWAAYR